MNKNLKYVLLLCLMAAFVWGIFIVINFINDNKKAIKIVYDAYNYDMKISLKAIETKISVDSEEYPGMYTRVLVNIKNNSANETSLSAMNFSLTDENDNVVAFCIADNIYGSEFENVLHYNMDGKTSNMGYLYCLTDNDNFAKLKVSVVSRIENEGTDNAKFIYDDYYIPIETK